MRRSQDRWLSLPWASVLGWLVSFFSRKALYTVMYLTIKCTFKNASRASEVL